MRRGRQAGSTPAVTQRNPTVAGSAAMVQEREIKSESADGNAPLNACLETSRRAPPNSGATFKTRRRYTKTVYFGSVIKHVVFLCIRLVLSLIIAGLVSLPLTAMAAKERGYTGAYGGEWLLIIAIFIFTFWLTSKIGARPGRTSGGKN